MNWRGLLAFTGLFGLPLLMIFLSDDKNLLPGGKGDKLKESDVDQNELLKGIRVEREHTSDERIAKEIALDHLAEDPKYYTKLERIHVEKNPQEKLQKR
jgi:hypothetical protein